MLPDTNVALRSDAAPRRPRSRLRVVLLAAVGMAALGGALTSGALAPHPALAAAGDAPSPVQAPAAGPGSFADVVDRVRGAVVAVKVQMTETATADDDDDQGPGNRGPGAGPGAGPGGPQVRPGDPLDRFFRGFGNNSPFRQAPRKQTALGSGFIISADGYIVTNNHVVENATDVSVTLDNGKVVPATVVGTDKRTDLALLKLKEGSNYPFVEFASTTPRVGDWVIAVGNPFGLGGTVTAGIVSARGRDIGAGPYDDFLQIDAPVNRGNSGGPTFDTSGRVVGVNTAIYSPSGGSVGIGFDIPADVVKNVIGALRDKGTVARGWIGVQIQPVTSDIADSLGLKSTDGALIADTQTDSPAAAAGIASGDVITEVNGTKVAGPRELARTIAGLPPGTSAQITYVHDGQTKTAAVKLGNLPAEQQAKGETEAPTPSNSLAKFGLTLAPAASVAGAGRQGVVVQDIDPNGVAAQQGLRTGDVILEAAGKSVARPSDISNALATAKKEGRKAVLLRVRSGDSVHFVALATTATG